jgi:2-polyprenyl-6-methoxyphenol hydroxylase-like FAD-dependent oxidoreductase
VHPRTLEVFAMRGIHEQMLTEGVQIPNGHFGVLENRLDFAALDTEFQFTLAYPQVRTEEILEKHAIDAGVELRKGHRVTNVRQNDDAVTLTVEGPDGSYEESAQYVVGCDGARSVVRAASEIGFPGTDSTVFGFLGDVALGAPPERIGYSCHGESGALMVAPLPGGIYRFVGVDPARQTARGEELTFEEFRGSVIRIAGTDFGMHDPQWLSRFGNATRLVDTYRNGRVLLAGDAAHIHFPTGGVGLNVGLQDAFNLGWKLARTIKDTGSAGLLDTYHHERHPVGQSLLTNSAAQTAVITAFSPEGQGLRTLLNELVATNPAFSLDLAQRLSALAVHYPDDSKLAHRLVGTRVPNTDLTGEHLGSRLYSLFTLTQPVLVNFTDNDKWASDAIRGFDATRTSIDPKNAPAQRNWDSVTAMLIRPDGHVSWASDATDPDSLSNGARVALG